MPAILSNARYFLQTIDYPIDQIVGLWSGSTVVSAGSPIVQVPHNLPFRPLVIGSFSETPDFSVSREAGLPQFGDISVPIAYMQSNPTNILISGQPQAGMTSQTIHWRAYGYEPSTSNNVVTPTSSIADNFSLNLEFNYTKLLMKGNVDVSLASAIIPHNLGYVPQVEVWGALANDPNVIERYYSGNHSTMDTFANLVTVTSNTLTITKPTLAPSQTYFEYRIYIDEA